MFVLQFRHLSCWAVQLAECQLCASMHCVPSKHAPQSRYECLYSIPTAVIVFDLLLSLLYG